MGRNALEGIARTVEEQVQRQVPQSPYHAKKYGAADEAEALLQQGLEIVAPAVLLTEEGGKAEEEIGYQHRYKYVGRRGLPVGKIPGHLSAEGYGQERAGDVYGHEQQQHQQGKPGPGPAKPVSGPALFSRRQQEDPGQYGTADYSIGLNCSSHGRPRRQSKINKAAKGHQRRKDDKEYKEAPGQGPPLLRGLPARPPPCDKAGQHHPGRRIEHLGVGEGVGVQAQIISNSKGHSHQEGKAVGHQQEKFQLALFNV